MTGQHWSDGTQHPEGVVGGGGHSETILDRVGSRSPRRGTDLDPTGVTASLQQISLDEQMPLVNSGSASSSRRLYCPVLGCPQADCRRAAGWTSQQSLRKHVEEHAAGRFMGTIPEDWLVAHNLGQCCVCSKLLPQRFGIACPRCRPRLVATVDPPVHVRAVPLDWPTLQQVCATRIPTKAYIPQNA